MANRFMWVDLQIKNICDIERHHTEADIRTELGKLPQGLGETYEAIFHKISSHADDSQRLAMATLRWIMCAQRPLSLDDINIAISVDAGGNMVNAANLDKETILRFCHNLVIWDSTQNVIRFAHLSVREFLEKSTDRKSVV